MNFRCDLEKAGTFKKVEKEDGVVVGTEYFWRVQLLIPADNVNANEFIDLQDKALTCDLATVQTELNLKTKAEAQ